MVKHFVKVAWILCLAVSNNAAATTNWNIQNDNWNGPLGIKKQRQYVFSVKALNKRYFRGDRDHVQDNARCVKKIKFLSCAKQVANNIPMMTQLPREMNELQR